ncbi:MAG: formyltransferase family protein [Candidatus Paceibacterota bacterium]
MNIALLISGGGTTMEAIIKATQNGTLKNVFPVLIIASNKNALGIEKAKKLGIKDGDILIINPKDFSDREEFGKKIIEESKKRNVDFIGQYGWMVMTPENVINTYKNMIVNQHPGPLDTGRSDFGGVGMYGMRVHQTRLCFVNKTGRPARNAFSIADGGGNFWTEATAHRVTTKFDEGVVLKRKQVPILEGDTAESLQQRVLPIEHEVQIELLKDFSEGKVAEFHREIPLVLEDEEDILKECKANAIKMYPKG